MIRRIPERAPYTGYPPRVRAPGPCHLRRSSAGTTAGGVLADRRGRRWGPAQSRQRRHPARPRELCARQGREHRRGYLVQPRGGSGRPPSAHPTLPSSSRSRPPSSAGRSTSRSTARVSWSVTSPICAVCPVARGTQGTTLVPLPRWIERYAPDGDWCTWRKLLFVNARDPISARGARAEAIEDALMAIGPRPYPTLLQGLLRRGLPVFLYGAGDGHLPDRRRTGSSRTPRNAPTASRSRPPRPLTGRGGVCVRGPASTGRPGPRRGHPDMDPRQLLCQAPQQPLPRAGVSVTPSARRRETPG